MIVVDTNIIAYLLIPGKETDSAEKILQKDPVWCSTRLWRSEFRNVLLKYLRMDYINLAQSFQIMQKAERLMRGREYEVNSLPILEASFNSKCSAYDCEFIILARELATKLITSDKRLLREFPEESISLRNYLSGS